MAHSLISRLLALPTWSKKVLQVLADVVIIWLALWLSFCIRLGIDQFVNPLGEYLSLFLAAPLFAIPSLIYFKLHKIVNRYFDNDAIIAIFKAMSLAALLLSLGVYWYQPEYLVPRSIVFIYWWLSIVLLTGFRLLVRHFLLKQWRFPFLHKTDRIIIPVAIYGAGSAGTQLVVALRMGSSMKPVAFIDDDAHLWGRTVSGIRVFSPKDIENMVIKTNAQEILLAIPSATRARRREILSLLEQYPLRIRSIPGIMDLANGRVKVNDIREIDIVDVLGRDVIPPDEALFEKCIKGKVVLVTGGGGSIGSELCRQIVGVGCNILLLLDHCEFNLYKIHLELSQYLKQKQSNTQLVPILGSVRDEALLFDVMKGWSVDTVYHAAAYKHVPMVEQNIGEGILNNVFGTLNMAQAAVRAKVANFVLISTDKAVRPTNIMGATKRIAELILQAISQEKALQLFERNEIVPLETYFTMVRFGNVLGSSGSVIPLFRQQIKSGGPITVTHPDVTRYFMTIPEAAQLVIQAGSMGEGGDVFVLDMGSPIKIVDLAEKMIYLSGLTPCSTENPKGDINIKFTGLRPGEKLYEELLIGDHVDGTMHPMIMRANEEHISWDAMQAFLQNLLQLLATKDYPALQLAFKQVVTGYQMESKVVDWHYLCRKNVD